MLLRIAVALTLVFAAAHGEPLGFDIREGQNLNSFLQDGQVAAHVVLRSGRDPRILVVFPAGNSGAGLWFARQDSARQWRMTAKPRPITANDDKGRPLHGVVFDAAIDAPSLAIKQIVLSNVRVIRDFEAVGAIPSKVVTGASATGQALTWQRERLDGAAGYRLTLNVTRGTIEGDRIRADPNGTIGLTVTALSGETPLSPADTLLTDRAGADPAARNALTFLSYKEKFLAGSWRFDTYFGRDTLLSLRLLMPVLTANAMADGLRSVLSRLSQDGQVAHEEDIGEFAILDHLKKDASKSDAPVFDYKMIDETVLLAPVAAAWLLNESRKTAPAFLAGTIDEADSGGTENVAAGNALVRNFRFVLAEAAPFASDPRARNLIGLKPGNRVGNWRDSNDGLGGGQYPYDVNAVLMPAALDAIARLFASDLLGPYLTAGDRKTFAHAADLARIWRTKAPPLFLVSIGGREALQRVNAYAASLAIPPTPAARSLPNSRLTFDALSLDRDGKPVPVLHSDGTFALMFTEPDAGTLERVVRNAMRPFPAGLMTEAGLVVADPVYADARLQAKFSPNAYHGAVVWSWQQAMFAAGLAHQLERRDLPSGVRRSLTTAQRTLWRTIETTRPFANSELWSWQFANRRFAAVPFGAHAADADESDAVQLWSTVYLAIPNPQ